MLALFPVECVDAASVQPGLQLGAELGLAPEPRRERDPELRAAVETWLAGTLLSALDWEQRKHERLLAA